jgi:hypothetical protein
MPAPIGKEPRDHKFLLRMTARQNSFCRALAKTRGTSLNDAITSLIEDRMARYGEPPKPAPQQQTEPQQRPAPQPRSRSRRRATAEISDLARGLMPPPVDPVPGQMPLTDDDQEENNP